MSRLLRIAALTLGLGLLLPASAAAHAVLLTSEPARGDTVPEPPPEVVLRFSEPVEAAFGALRVVGADGARVDDGESGHPAGRKDELRVGLRPGLADGTYVATYRVISADSHPVSGGVVFSVGEAGAAPADVTELLGAEAGPVTTTALKVARGVAYLATAVIVGGLVFLLLVWGPAARGVGASAGAGTAFATRVRRLLGGAALLGALGTAAGLALQAAIASATTFWGALDPDILRELLQTNFGQAWTVRLLAFTAVGVVVPFLRPAAAADPDPPPEAARIVSWCVAALAGAALVVTPALSGHARATSPVALNVAVDALHVAAMAAWIGGLILLLAAVPAATRALDPAERTRLLAAVLQRFSPLALVSVALVVATGVYGTVVYLDAVGDLVDSEWGRLVLAKIVLLVLLIGLGAFNQRRTMPRLRRLAAEGAPPGDDGRTLRSALRAEVALAVVVLGVTAVLVGISPPAAGATGGPISIEQRSARCSCRPPSIRAPPASTSCTSTCWGATVSRSTTRRSCGCPQRCRRRTSARSA